MQFYTLDRDGTLSPEQIIILNNVDPFNIRFANYEEFFNLDELKAHLHFLFPDGLSYHGWKYIKGFHTSGVGPFSTDLSCISEMNFEYTRRAFYSDKISRLQSFFAVDAIENAYKFRDIYSADTNKKIYLVEAEEFLKADMNLIKLGTQNIAGSLLAHKYWRGEQSQNPFWEYLLKSPIKVIGEVE